MELALQLIETAKQQRVLHLDLGNCGLKELPDELFELTWLESLGLGDYNADIKSSLHPSENRGGENQIEVLPEEMSQLTALKHLTIGNFGSGIESDNKIYSISSIGGCKSLWSLNVFNSSIRDISFLEGLNELRQLYLDGFKITDISPLKNLTNLQELGLSGTLVNDISPLKYLTNLQVLGLSRTPLNDISVLVNLINLQKLYLNETLVSNISPLANLTRLQNISLAGTQVSDISSLKNLTELCTLDLERTQVRDISPLLTLLKKPLQVLSGKTFLNSDIINLNKTSVPNIIYDLVGDNNEKLINYLEQIAQSETPPQKLYEAKLMVVGEPGAGKTSLMNKLLDPNYKLPESCDADSTTGINIESWPFKIPDKEEIFQAHIWDFGGQKRQYMTHQFFLTAHTVYVLVASNDRKEQDNFPYWFKIISLLGRDNASNLCSPLLIFLNQRESKLGAPVFSFNFDAKLYEQQYPDLQFDNKRFDLNDPVELQAFTHKLQKSLLKLHHIGDPVPAQWIAVRKQLSQLAEKQPYISLREFQILCCKHGINNEGYQDVFSYRLHTLGSILHFQDDDVLRETIIIDPNWAVDAVYSVLKDGRIERREGYFSRADLQQIWGTDYSASEQSHLLRLMSYEAFEICYPIDRQDNDHEWYLAPQFLADNSADYELKSEQAPLKFRFSYTFMPEGIVARLIVRLHEDILMQDGNPLAWKTGFILESNGAQLQLQEREQGGLKVLDIEAGGKTDEQKYIIRKVRDEVSRIHHRWFKGIQVNEMVPCSCPECKDSSTPHYFKNEVLQRRLQKNRTHIDCEKSVERVDIRGLLEGIYQQDELPKAEGETDKLNQERSFGVVNNFSVAKGAQLVVPQGGTNQPIIQANEQAQVEAAGKINKQPDNCEAVISSEFIRQLMPAPTKKPFYQQWWAISLLFAALVSGAVGLWLSSFWLGLLAGGCIFAAMMFFQPGKTYRRVAWLCVMAVISSPLLSGMVGQNPELKDGKLGFVFKLNESLPTIVLLGLIGLAGFLFWLDYLKNKQS